MDSISILVSRCLLPASFLQPQRLRLVEEKQLEAASRHLKSIKSRADADKCHVSTRTLVTNHGGVGDLNKRYLTFLLVTPCPVRVKTINSSKSVVLNHNGPSFDSLYWIRRWLRSYMHSDPRYSPTTFFLRFLGFLKSFKKLMFYHFLSKTIYDTKMF